MVSEYKYKTCFGAKIAGYKAFVSICYSQIDDGILEKITHYRNELKPYYTADSNSVYAGKNKKISDLLREIQETVGAGRLSSDFCTVDVFPDTNGTFWKMLNHGELISNDYIGMVKRKFDYSASDYKKYIDCDSMDGYRGKIYYYNAGDASRELGRDLGNALEYASGDIEDFTLVYIKDIVNSYNKNLKNCLDKKIELIKNLSFN